MADTANRTNTGDNDIVPASKVDGWESTHIDGKVDEQVDGMHDGVVYRSSYEDLPMRTTFRIMWKGVLVCSLAAFSSFTDGYQLLLIANMVGHRGFINQMGTEISRVTGQPILAASVLSAWGAIGSACQWLGMNIFPFISDKIGRKYAMLTYWGIIAISVAIESAASTWQHWTASKVFQGLGIGAMQFSLQLYINELSPTAKIRGTMLALYNFWWVLGQFVGTIAITMEVRRDPLDWKTPVYTQWAQVGIMGIIYVLIPESPWWLAKKGKRDAALKILNRLYGKITDYSAETEYAVIEKTIEHEEAFARQAKEVSWRAIFSGINGWRTFVACYGLLTTPLIGQGFLNSYVIYFFEIAGSTDPFANTCITSALGIVANLILVFFLDKIGRRRIVLTGFTTQWVCLIVIGGLGQIQNRNAALNGFLIALACTWSLTFYMSAGACWAYVGEVPNARLRARSTGFAAGIGVLVGLPVGYVTPYMINDNQWNWGLKTCFFYAGLSFFFVLAAYAVLPEVTRRTPAELDEMFENKVKPWRFRKYVTEAQKRHVGRQDGADDHVLAA